MPMLDRLIRPARQALHVRQCAAVLATPPVVSRDDGTIVFSMIGTRVLAQYLVAVKSLMHVLQRGRVVIIDDNSLTAADRAVLSHHLNDPVIYRLADVDVGPCPHGGTWERILTLIDLAQHDYVIQLDSDTVTIGDVPEVRAAVDARRSFTLLGGEDAQAQGLLDVAAFRAKAYPDGPIEQPDAHVQTKVESRIDRLDPSRRYIRGCAGFAGFAAGTVNRGEAYTFSQQCEALVGRAVWEQWGSEQITSNWLVANAPDPVLLPYARYYNYWDDGDRADPALIHFVGTHRYTGDAYARATATALTALKG